MENQALQTENIWSLILRFSIPSMIALLVNTIYNIIDRIFIGQFVGAHALAGLTVVYPIMFVIFAGSALIGRGGANLLSISLGKGIREDYQEVFTTTVVTALVFGLIMLGVGFIGLKPMLRMLGASGDVYQYAYDYMWIILVGVIFWIMSFTLSSTVRAEGKAMLSMMAMIASALMNIILDYVFIVTLSMGVQGAALATIIAQTLGFVILAHYYIMVSKEVKIKRRYLKPRWAIVKRLFTIGIPSYFVTVGSGISMMVLNRYLGLYGGVGAIASMGAISSLMTFFNIPALGIQNGIQPIIGFNYGADNYIRMRETVIKAILVTFIMGVAIFIGIRFYSATLIALFIDDANYIKMGSQGLKMYALLIPFTAIINIAIAYFQSVEKSLQATLISALKQILLLVPMVVVFSALWGIRGIWYAVPVADGLTILVAVSMWMYEMKKDQIKYEFREDSV